MCDICKKDPCTCKKKVEDDHKKGSKEKVSPKKECPLSTLIVKVKTSKGKVVGQAKVTVFKDSNEVVKAGGLTDDIKGEHNTGKILEEGNYTVKVKKKCHKPAEAKKTGIALGKNKTKDVDLTLDPYEIKITAKKVSYTVVLKKDGTENSAHPILEFEIKDGPPNHFFDIQLSRDSAAGLTGGPGLGGAWDKTASRDDRVGKKLFSSWTNGDTTLKLDSDGKVKYKMPLEWWKDLARIPRKDFDKKNFYYRVLAMDTDTDTSACMMSAPNGGASAPKVEVKNNLKTLLILGDTFIDNGYALTDKARKSVEFQFKVRENNTGEMYTFVQWKQGITKYWSDNTNWKYGKVTDYGLKHRANIDEWSIDRLETNPRYWGGPSFKDAGDKTGYCTDAPSVTKRGFAAFKKYDFDTRVHLDFEVKSPVKVTKKEPDPPVGGVYDKVIGKLLDPQPVILDRYNWTYRILLKKQLDGSYVMTHPDTYPP